MVRGTHDRTFKWHRFFQNRKQIRLDQNKAPHNKRPQKGFQNNAPPPQSRTEKRYSAPQSRTRSEVRHTHYLSPYWSGRGTFECVSVATGASQMASWPWMGREEEGESGEGESGEGESGEGVLRGIEVCGLTRTAPRPPSEHSPPPPSPVGVRGQAATSEQTNIHFPHMHTHTHIPTHPPTYPPTHTPTPSPPHPLLQLQLHIIQ